MRQSAQHELMKNTRLEILGTLHNFSETGTEGSWYSVFEHGKSSYDALHTLENNDYLVIYQNLQTIWEGFICRDMTLNLTNETGYPYPRQVVNGVIVHWAQRQVDLEKWGQWFDQELEASVYPISKPRTY
jgi:hypothetical protein